MTRSAEFAVEAWREGRRRRRTAAAIDRIAEGAIAAGGFVLVNATTGLGYALPSGRAGISIGAGAVCAGLAWVSRARRTRTARMRAGRAPHAAPELRRAA